jgi:hypothetical protein
MYLKAAAYTDGYLSADQPVDPSSEIDDFIEFSYQFVLAFAFEFVDVAATCYFHVEKFAGHSDVANPLAGKLRLRLFRSFLFGDGKQFGFVSQLVESEVIVIGGHPDGGVGGAELKRHEDCLFEFDHLAVNPGVAVVELELVDSLFGSHDVRL